MSKSPKEISVQVGPGFCGLLTILFIGLKLTGYIAWSWLWVLSPLWLGFVLVLACVAAFLGFWCLALLVAYAWQAIRG
jgi:hypothetical protein